jgi:hypothetical protein
MDRADLDKASGDKRIAEWKQDLQLRKSVPDEYMVGEVQTSDFTNQNGLKVPLSFSFKSFRPDIGTHPRKDCIGTVTNLTDMTDQESFQPPIITRLSVTDTRFRFRDATRSVDELNYGLMPGGKWPPHDSFELRSELEARLGYMPASAKPLPRDVRMRRLVLAGVFLLAALFLPVYLYRLAQRKRR